MMTSPLRLAGLAAQELRWAELNEAWAYMESLLNMLKEMGARITPIPDPRYQWRNDYIISFRKEDALPGVIM